ncbi:YHYH protein [Hymenobacter busanensis]|uniref:YHYH protein n=1 Tax=Hymenobacter busanensis TaxID=2607656 RepID=A0A7L5A3Y3_9BACT|nr:YHYH protein [Hymenobacter busanensis]KAA9338203.1 YHYH protein [Hymenobacter busanensis]QHJ09372.1 YHYH protein [Hymenobacter busanensis]
MQKHLYAFFLFLFPALAQAQVTPNVSSWVVNTTGATGYNGILSNVQRVQYSAGNVYVTCTGIPSYTIGPWPNNPNTATNQNFVFKITRTPQPNPGTPTATPLGHTGLWSNGVSIFNAKDAMSYNNQGVWNQNAIVVEGPSFDSCLGHPAGNGEYHHHLNPRCLYNDHDSSRHSPIIGFAFDGYPIYGAYGYANASTPGALKSMRSSYRARSITQRTTLPDGTALPANQYGPAISTVRPLGYYIEDFEYVAGRGDLDSHNGRWCVTPEYPGGTYAYFVTLNRLYEGAYPYTPGPTYYGLVPAGATGPTSGHATVTEPVTTYVVTAAFEAAGQQLRVYPNPASTTLTIALEGGLTNTLRASLFNALGQSVGTAADVHPSVPHQFDLSRLAAGVYFLRVAGPGTSITEKIIVTR